MVGGPKTMTKKYPRQFFRILGHGTQCKAYLDYDVVVFKDNQKLQITK